MKKDVIKIILVILFGLFIIITTVASLTGVQPAASIVTSNDGKYVYIVGATHYDFYQSSDYGKTFKNVKLPN